MPSMPSRLSLPCTRGFLYAGNLSWRPLDYHRCAALTTPLASKKTFAASERPRGSLQRKACWGPCVQDPGPGVVTDHGLGTAAFRIPAQALLTAENSLLLKTTAWACGLAYGLGL